MSVYDDFFGSFTERKSEKHSQYTAEEIDRAAAEAKRTGCTLMEALQKQTGRSLDTQAARREQDELKAMGISADLSGSLSRLQSSLSDLKSTAASTASDFFGRQTGPAQAPRQAADAARSPEGAAADTAQAAPAETQDDLSARLDAMNRHLQEDFGIGTAAEAAAPAPEAGLEAFDGAAEAVAQQVFGQTAFLRKLVVAFKRPFVLPEEEGHPRSSFLITGPEDSGRHTALTALVKELASRKILSSSEVQLMDLSVYTAAGKDNVFLQDLYMALQAKAQVLAFEGYAHCHVSYLGYLSDLVLRGKCMLQDRYVLQKGQLVNVSNSFASEAVSSFSAAGKYLVFFSTKGVDSLAAVMGAPFVNALGDVCTAAPLTEESYRAIAEVRWQALLGKAEKQLGFVLQADADAICDAAVAAAGKHAGTAGVLGFFDNTLKALATMKLEGTYARGTAVKLTIEDGRLKATADGVETDLLASLPAAYTGEIEAVRAELDSIVGLKAVKEYILSLEEYYSTQKRRAEAGLRASEVSKHMIFTGNPGTGKTTIARIVSRYLKAIGVLSGGQLVEVSRADLVGRYVGHTAPLVNKVLQSAMGGVLFIDEAYSLYRGKEDSFGLEAIDTLVKGIEDNRDNLIVILAGYSHEMEEFLEANSGLRSRFPNFIDFPDYTGQELLEITRITVKSRGYTLDAGTEDALLAYYNLVQAVRADTAGNGRLVRNKVEEAILNQSRRLTAEPEADLSLLESRDFDLSDAAEV